MGLHIPEGKIFKFYQRKERKEKKEAEEEEEEEEGRIMQKKHELPMPITKRDIVLRYVIKGKKMRGSAQDPR